MRDSVSRVCDMRHATVAWTLWSNDSFVVTDPSPDCAAHDGVFHILFRWLKMNRLNG